MKCDAELIRNVQAGSKSALEVLYVRYLPPLWRYVNVRLGGDRQEAEDVSSETFMAAIIAIGDGKFKPARPFYPWLIGVARHKLTDRYRRKRRRTAACKAKVVPQNTHNPATGLLGNEHKAEVATAMARIPNKQRLVLEWKYLDNLNVHEIANQLGRSEKAVEALLYRGRRSFRAMMKKYHGGGDDD